MGFNQFKEPQDIFISHNLIAFPTSFLVPPTHSQHLLSMASTAPHDLTTESGILAYLADTQFPASRVQVVTGGNANYTFRATLQNPLAGHPTVIVKHAEPFLPGSLTFAFTVERQVK